MERYIALLRAVNVGGSSLKMDAFRAALSGLGYLEVQTLLQSGNAVFQAPPRPERNFERAISERLVRDTNVRTEVFVRSGPEWAGVISANPFPKEAREDPAHLVVVALAAAPAAAAWKALDAAIVGHEYARGIGRHAYVVYPDGIGRSRLTAAVLERSLGTRGTARNWNTVTKLQGLVNG